MCMLLASIFKLNELLMLWWLNFYCTFKYLYLKKISNLRLTGHIIQLYYLFQSLSANTISFLVYVNSCVCILLCFCISFNFLYTFQKSYSSVIRHVLFYRITLNIAVKLLRFYLLEVDLKKWDYKIKECFRMIFKRLPIYSTNINHESVFSA